MPQLHARIVLSIEPVTTKEQSGWNATEVTCVRAGGGVTGQTVTSGGHGGTR